VYRPTDGVAVIWLDPYDVSTIQPAPPHTAEEAYAMLEEKNPNNIRAPSDWTAGLSGPEKRFVPYNGAVGREQLAWLEGEINAAEEAGEIVLVACHIPLMVSRNRKCEMHLSGSGGGGETSNRSVWLWSAVCGGLSSQVFVLRSLCVSRMYRCLSPSIAIFLSIC